MTVDLRTRYLGIDLRSPIVPSASPIGQRLETLLAVQDAGAGAIVLPSLFEEQIEHDELQLHGALDAFRDATAEALTYLPDIGDYNTGVEPYLRHVEDAKKALEIPVIASLNGIGLGNWVSYAKRMQEAGADAIELNVYFIAADTDETGDEVEERYVKLVEAVRGEITIPLAVKIGPFFSSIGHMAHRLVAAGADGLVLFNRFMQPDIDVDTLTLDTTVRLSTSAEALLPLRWVGILRDRVHASLATTTGVHSAEDALKMLLVGADVVMLASALLHHGPGHVATVLDGVTSWMSERGYGSVAELRGSMSQAKVPNPVAFTRANYAKLVTSFVSPYDWRMAHPEGELLS